MMKPEYIFRMLETLTKEAPHEHLELGRSAVERMIQHVEGCSECLEYLKRVSRGFRDQVLLAMIAEPES